MKTLTSLVGLTLAVCLAGYIALFSTNVSAQSKCEFGTVEEVQASAPGYGFSLVFIDGDTKEQTLASVNMSTDERVFVITDGVNMFLGVEIDGCLQAPVRIDSLPSSHKPEPKRLVPMFTPTAATADCTKFDQLLVQGPANGFNIVVLDGAERKDMLEAMQMSPDDYKRVFIAGDGTTALLGVEGADGCMLPPITILRKPGA